MQRIKIDSRKALTWTLGLAIISLGVNAGRLAYSRWGGQEARSSRPIPYTTILRETVHSPDGTTTVAADETFAVRSDGSFAKRLAHKKQIGGKLVDSDSERTIYLASGIEIQVNDLANTKSTEASKVNLAKFQRDPSSKCINTFDGNPPTPTPEVIIGEETVAGYRAVIITSTKASNWKWWYALDCGCAEIKARIDWGQRPERVRRVEPCASCLQAPRWKSNERVGDVCAKSYAEDGGNRQTRRDLSANGAKGGSWNRV
jgi:hypothetical protein